MPRLQPLDGRGLCKGQRPVEMGGIPPLRSIDESIKELRWAKEQARWESSSEASRGIATLDNPYFFPVYQEASDLDLPICIHQGSGCPMFINFFDLERNRQWSHSAILPLFAFNDIVNNKIPELFPRLQVRLHRGLRNLGAVSAALVQTTISRAVEILFDPGSIPRISNFYRLRNGRKSPCHRRLHRRGQPVDWLGLRPQRSLRAAQSAADSRALRACQPASSIKWCATIPASSTASDPTWRPAWPR